MPVDDLKDFKMLFSEFRPLFLNRLAKGHAQKLIQPRTCSPVDQNLTFRPRLSPRNQFILQNKNTI